LFNKEAFSKMKSNAIFVNIALVDALHNKIIAVITLDQIK